VRLTREQARKLISGEQRSRAPRKMLVLPVVQKDLLGTHVQLDLPILVVSPNSDIRERWQAIGRRRAGQKEAIEFWASAFRHVRNPEAIGLVRIAPGKFDGDNLAASFKAVRDAIANVYGRDDADWKKGAVAWTYSQMSMGRLYGVRIAVVGSLI
jgi:hypothetical protein